MALSDGERERVYEEELIREAARNHANSRSRKERKIIVYWVLGPLAFIVIARWVYNLFSEDIYLWFLLTGFALLIIAFGWTLRERVKMTRHDESGPNEA